MKNKGLFTEKEDQAIILCLKEATGPNISVALRRASTLTGRSFSSIYGRYLNKQKFSAKSMEREITNFNDWKLMHNFYYGKKEYTKECLTLKNYNNIFKKDWEAMMEVVEKIETLGYYVMINRWTSIYTGKGIERTMISSVENQSKIENTYYACIEFIKWLNNEK